MSRQLGSRVVLEPSVIVSSGNLDSVNHIITRLICLGYTGCFVNEIVPFDDINNTNLKSSWCPLLTDGILKNLRGYRLGEKKLLSTDLPNTYSDLVLPSESIIPDLQGSSFERINFFSVFRRITLTINDSSTVQNATNFIKLITEKYNVDIIAVRTSNPSVIIQLLNNVSIFYLIFRI